MVWRGRGAIENAFGMLKETWREILDKTELNVKYLLDVITTCAILYNALSNQGKNNVDCLHSLIDNDGFDFGGKDLGKKVYNDVQNASLQHHGEELAFFFGFQRGLDP